METPADSAAAERERCRACSDSCSSLDFWAGSPTAPFRAGHLVEPKPREITVTIPPDKLSKHAERAHPWPAGRTPTTDADRTVPRHARAERGASANTLAAYRRDLADFAADLARRRQRSRRADSDDTARAISARLAKRGLQPPRWRGGCRRSASSIASSTRRPSRRRSGRGDRRPEARPRAAEGSRPSSRSTICSHGARRACRPSSRAGTAARGAARLPARSALRHRPARLRTGGAARRRRRGATSAC